MPVVTNNCGSDFGFYLTNTGFALFKGANPVNNSVYEELLQQPLFNEIVKQGKFVVTELENKPENLVTHQNTKSVVPKIIATPKTE